MKRAGHDAGDDFAEPCARRRQKVRKSLTREPELDNPGRPKPKGTIMKRAGHDAGDDFADNRVPGGDKRFGRA